MITLHFCAATIKKTRKSTEEQMRDDGWAPEGKNLIYFFPSAVLKSHIHLNWSVFNLAMHTKICLSFPFPFFHPSFGEKWIWFDTFITRWENGVFEQGSSNRDKESHFPCHIFTLCYVGFLGWPAVLWALASLVGRLRCHCYQFLSCYLIINFSYSFGIDL